MRRTNSNTPSISLEKDLDLFCEFTAGNGHAALGEAVRFVYGSRVTRLRQQGSTSLNRNWSEVDYKDYPRFSKVKLPHPEIKDTRLVRALAARASCRAFGRSAVEAETISELLGSVHADRRDSRYPSRAFPAAGGLYCAETYLVTGRITDLLPGVYHYAPQSHDLHVIPNRSDAWKTVRLSLAQDIGTPAAFIVESVRLGPLISKYGLRGMRFAILEIGAAAQALDLVATSLGLSTLWLGGFEDEQLWDLLGVSPLHELEVPLLIIALGYKSGKPSQANAAG